MSVLQNSLSSSAARAVILRRRPDLAVTAERYDGQTFYMIKDPVGLRYYRFKEEEYYILDLLNGQRSLSDIKKNFESRFKPQRLKYQELQSFIGKLHESGLVLSQREGQGAKLLQRSDERRMRQLRSTWANPLYIKLPGFDPERVLQRMHPYFTWVFTPGGVIGALLLMLSALLLVAINFDDFQGRPEWQSFHAFFNFSNIGWMWLAMALVKIVHEFGHGLTCTHFGGECHEMGMLLLIFSPGLYCNVSDAWMLPNKWHRIWISAAGIYVEVVLASLATWIWWYTAPGLVHSLSFSVMFVCSVSTILLNANPLMRFDGYYVTSDLLEIPNLQRKASELFQRAFAKWCLGADLRDSSLMPQNRRWMFIVYATAVYIYRWMVSFTILWFLYSFLRPYKLGAIGVLLALSSIFSLAVLPVYQMVKFVTSPGRTVKVSKIRLAASLLGIAGLVAAVLCVPIPLRVTSVLTLEPRNADYVFVSVPGTLRAVHVKPGQAVRKGDLLAELENEPLRVELESLERQITGLEASSRTYLHLDMPAERQQAQNALADARKLAKNRREQLARLTLRADRDGLIIPVPERPEKNTVDQEGLLVNWERSPLYSENLGSHLEAGTPLCSVGDPREMQAVLIIDQADIEFVRAAQSVKMKLEALADTTLRGTISEIAQQPLEDSPAQVSSRSGGELATRTDDNGRERPVNSSYQATVPLDNSQGLLEPGFRGRAKIECGTRTCWQWFWRSILRTFHFSF
jgi:putative peptide zinc metalloprotease protein